MDLHVAGPMSGEASADLPRPSQSPKPIPGPAPDPGHPDGTPTLEVDDVAAIELAPAGAPAAEPAAPESPAGPPPAAAPAAAAPDPGKPEPKAGPKLNRKRRKRKSRWDMPAWGLSAVIHLGILALLALVATSSGEVVRQIVNLDATTVLGTSNADELMKIYADPADVSRDSAVGNPDAAEAGASFDGVGTAAPSATPVVRGTGRAVGERTMLPTVKVENPINGLGAMPTAPARDLIGRGLIGGDPTFEAKEVGTALDQITKEIRRHLLLHKVSVIWMFDESESMRDDQREIKAKFDRVSSELKVHLPEMVKGKAKPKNAAWPPLTHAIVGFGEDLHFEQEKPTENIDAIGKAIDRLVIDTTGKEQTMAALQNVINKYGSVVPKDVQLLVVLVTDESGDDGEFIEEARQALMAHKAQLFVIGRQAIFGHGIVHIRYEDPVTKDIYWPGIRRGPETADFECLQYDGLHGRNEEQPSGFAPYELARLAKETGGVYFLLPTEEEMRVSQREKAYSMVTLKEYVPDYENRADYNKRRFASELRRTLYDVITLTKDAPFRIDYPIFPDELRPAIEEQYAAITDRLKVLNEVEKRLRQLEKVRNLEQERRWQAAYDLMLAQVVCYQVKTYEFRAMLEDMYRNPPKPSRMPTEDHEMLWHLDHSRELRAPKEKTEKVVAEANRLLKLVIERHPNTPWSDLAKDEVSRGMGVGRSEWHRSKRYDERAKLVPKY